MILPCDNYNKARLERSKKDLEEIGEHLIPALFDKIFPTMMKSIKDNLLEEMLEEEGEVSAVIGIKIQKVLAEEGFEIKKTRELPRKQD